MCGICGIISFNNNPVKEGHIRDMMQVQKHRGPDDDGLFIKDNLGLGFVRLSILDLSAAGHQPMFSDDGVYVVVYNGEIFNYIELREELKQKGYFFKTDTDTEVLINSYKEWGEECLHKFNGMWAFAIYNIEDGKLFMARDRYGIKPFYYFQNDDIFAFASEIPSLLKLFPIKPEANNQAIFDYLVFNRTDQTSETFFKDVFKLQHGQCITVNTKDNFAVSKPYQWYNLRLEIRKKARKRLTAAEFKTLFDDAIRIRLRSDVPVGVCLSGGLDSSAIVSTLLKNFDKRDLCTFSAVYDKGQFGDETYFIKLYENELQNMYYTRPTSKTLLNDLDKFVKIHAEPIPATGPYAQYKVMELAKDNVVVTLDGQGADEMLAGYHYFFGFYFKDLLKHLRLARLLKEIYKYIKIHKSFFGIKSFIYFLLPKTLRTKTRVGEKTYLNQGFVKRFSKSNTIAGNLYGSKSLNEALINHFEYKLEHLLKWEDRNSMAFSLEARVPFLDHRLVESTLSADGRDIIIDGMTKAPLREAMKGILPEEIRLRTDKIGFGTPQDEWFRDESFQVLINEILSSESFKQRRIIDVVIAKQLYQKHLNNEVNISKEIWKWIHLELWFRAFID
ncbi:MAG: asparagine synthase (glutamine-hydrolyzing) [Bacteroidetes bacterium]|nr:asparagine synthase (glutamine-hydrolyzing) [Bacteroidota bacterium]